MSRPAKGEKLEGLLSRALSTAQDRWESDENGRGNGPQGRIKTEEAAQQWIKGVDKGEVVKKRPKQKKKRKKVLAAKNRRIYGQRKKGKNEAEEITSWNLDR